MNLNRLFVFIALVAGAASAGAQETHFSAEDTHIAGSAYVKPPAGGEYVYGEAPKDGRQKTRPFFMAPVPRQSYTFFSAEEERLLQSLRDKQTSAQTIKEKVVTARKAHYKKTKRLDWPKVVLRGDEICVPVLASADAEDWAQNLTCYNVAGAN